MAMELRALFLLPLCFPGLQGQTLEAERRQEGDTLNVNCTYTAGTQDWYPKYWCVVKDRRCQELARIDQNREQSKDKRIKMKLDSRTVSVTMTDLQAEDSGTYSCAYYTTEHVLKRISLNVFKELLKWELDTLSVQCPVGYSVAWCRGGQTDCTVLAERGQNLRQSGRRSSQDGALIEYSAQDRTLTVTKKRLQTGDTGVYWCVLGPGPAWIREVKLSVFKRTQQHTAEESSSISVQCHYKTSDYGAVSKAWCKKEEGERCNVLATTSSEPPGGPSTAQEGRVRIQDDTQQGIVTVTMGQLQAQDSGVYWCVLQESPALSRMEEVTLNVSKALPPGGFPDTESKSEEILLGNCPELSSDGNAFLILSVVLLILLVLALITSIVLCVRYSQLLARTGIREAEDTSDRAEGTAQPGSTGRRGSSQDDSKGPAYINLDMQPHSSPEDPLYCNVEPSQAPRNPQNVEYAVIAFSQCPRNGRE